MLLFSVLPFLMTGHSQAPGSDRWGSHHAHPPLTDPNSPEERRTPNKEALHSRDAPANSHSKYTPEYMVARFQELESAKKLSLPAGVNKEDSSLFAVPGQPSVKEVLSGLHDKLPPNSSFVDTFSTPSHQPSRDLVGDKATPSQQTLQAAAAAAKVHSKQNHQDPAGSSRPGEKAGSQNHDSTSKSQQAMSSPFAAAPDAAKAGHEHVQDAWVYRDPNWQIQGPFPKADILDWFEGGFFPADLPIRHAANPHADFKPLAAQIKVWAAAAPPGFAQPPAAAAAAPSQLAQAAPDTSASRQALGQAQSAHQAAQQPSSDIDRTFTLTSAPSYPQPPVAPKTASSARLDALETGLGAYGSAQDIGFPQQQQSQQQQQQQQPQQQHQQQHSQQPAAQNATPDIIMQLLNASSRPSGAPAHSLPGLQGLGGDFLRQSSSQQLAVPSLGSWSASGHPQHGGDSSAALFGNHSLHAAPQQHALPTSLFPVGNSMAHQASQAQAPSSNSFAQLLGLQQQPLPQSLAQQPIPMASRVSDLPHRAMQPCLLAILKISSCVKSSMST